MKTYLTEVSIWGTSLLVSKNMHIILCHMQVRTYTGIAIPMNEGGTIVHSSVYTWKFDMMTCN